MNEYECKNQFLKQYSKLHFLNNFIKGLMAFSTFEIVPGLIQFFKLYFKPQRQGNAFALLLQKLMVWGILCWAEQN